MKFNEKKPKKYIKKTNLFKENDDHKKTNKNYFKENKASDICGVCFTSSWSPCPPGTPNSSPDGSGGYRICSYCNLIKELERISRKLSFFDEKDLNVKVVDK